MEELLNFKKLIKDNGFIKYFKNTTWVLLEKTLRIIVGLFVGVWVVRYLGPEEFGVFSYVNSLVFFFIIISSLGLDGVLVRELVKDESKRDLLVGSAFFLKFFASIIILFLVFFLINFIDIEEKTEKLTLIITFSTIFQSFNVIDFYFQSKILSKFVVYSNVISLLLSSIVKITLILTNCDVIAFAYVVLFDSFILALGFIYFYTKNSKSILKWKFNKEYSIKLLGYSWPFILSGILIAVYMKVDQLMLKMMLGDKAVGIYAAGVRLSEVWYFIPVAIVSSLFPAIVNAKMNSAKLYSKRLQSLYDLMSLLSIVIALCFTFLSNWIVNIFYGSVYAEAATILVIHIWSGVFVFLGVASEKWLLNENFQKIYSINTLIGSLLNILLNYILIKQIGILGAAWSTLVSQFVASYFCLFFYKKTRKNFIKLTKSLFLINYIKMIKNV
jgi:O-antigen/teichoic acid export membrane protein